VGVPAKQPTSASQSVSIEGTFGVVLRTLRRGQDMSQEELAHISGYHRNYIGLLERGEKSPSLRTLFNLSGALSVPPSQILRRVERLLKKKGRAL
jgi:transcriptional regulator with XRE-family HTH domain